MAHGERWIEALMGKAYDFISCITLVAKSSNKPLTISVDPCSVCFLHFVFAVTI